jgi:hypothetical protein
LGRKLLDAEGTGKEATPIRVPLEFYQHGTEDGKWLKKHA